MVAWDPIPPGEFDVTLPGPAALIDDETWILFDGSGNGGGPLVEKTTKAGDSWEVIAALGG